MKDKNTTITNRPADFQRKFSETCVSGKHSQKPERNWAFVSQFHLTVHLLYISRFHFFSTISCQ